MAKKIGQYIYKAREGTVGIGVLNPQTKKVKYPLQDGKITACAYLKLDCKKNKNFFISIISKTGEFIGYYSFIALLAEVKEDSNDEIIIQRMQLLDVIPILSRSPSVFFTATFDANALILIKKSNSSINDTFNDIQFQNYSVLINNIILENDEKIITKIGFQIKTFEGDTNERWVYLLINGESIILDQVNPVFEIKQDNFILKQMAIVHHNLWRNITVIIDYEYETKEG